MSWPLSLLFGLIAGFAGAAYGGLVADLSLRWARVSAFGSSSGYFVAFMILLAFCASTILGVILCRVAGGRGVLRGFGTALGGVFLLITLFGALAWVQRDMVPEIRGAPVAVAVELRLPASVVSRPRTGVGGLFDVTLESGRRPHRLTSLLDMQEAREEEGRWIVPVTVPLTSSEGDRVFTLRWQGEAQSFRTPIPGRPTALDAQWSPWLTPVPPPAPDQALALRYRLVPRAGGR